MRIEVLDHGYVALVESWGSDERIIEAARMSTGKGFLGWKKDDYYECSYCTYKCAASLIPAEQEIVPCPNDYGRGDHGDPMRLRESPPGDEKLLAYLWKNHHHTPFEMGGMIIEVQAPIFVFREWHRHRTQSYNELSARYTPLPDLNYVPSVERIMLSGGANKQAQSTGAQITPEYAEGFRQALVNSYNAANGIYNLSLDVGIPKELARLCIPVGRYSRMRASANLRNWLAFMTLRCDEHAQWEIRQYADVVSGLVKELFPRTHELWSAQ